MLEWIWGLKTVAIFDVWTFEHILSGVSVGHVVWKDNTRHFEKHYPTLTLSRSTRIRVDFLGLLFLAYLWETLEHYLEEGIAGATVAYWFQGVEFWPNRFVSDPLMLVLGYWIAGRYPHLIVPARIVSVVWLIVHIFVFPHSMYLHELFGP
jgi:hypothetical protein